MSEDKLKKQYSILKEMFNASWNGIAIITLEGKFVITNRAMSPLLGYTDKELLELCLTDIILPEYQDIFTNLLSENIENTYVNTAQIKCTRKDGQIIFLDIFVHLMSNNKMFTLNATDITKSMAEQELINKVIIKYSIDKEGKIISVSDAFCSLLKYSNEELINKNYEELIHNATDTKNKEEFFTATKDEKAWAGPLTLHRKDKKEFYVNCTSKSTTNKYGDVVGHTVVMMDMTSQLNLEKHEVILENKLHDGEERLSIMSETMRTVAHEWRQPLNAISLDAQGLLFDLEFDDEVPKDRVIESLESISTSTQALSTIIENFQGVTELKGSKKKRNIKEILLEALKISELNEKSFVHENHETSASFRTYPKELAMALSSILTNAKEFTKELEEKNINIFTKEEDDKVICEITNNGGHIPEDILPQIFTPYFSTKEEKNGVGLSLYTCKVIIELHLKGYMEVQNIDENSVKFTLTFPMKALES